eukprot:GILK01007622.1.p1 GENE.GILK01007622.1~~GILK01007622.1.p1  ORF type:complete len:406 (-),score=30.97 GILK01007622.1:187-1383(-)
MAPSKLALLLALALLCTSVLGTIQSFSTATCGTTCSPDWCSFNSNSVCSLTEYDLDINAKLNALTCKVCNAITSGVCSSFKSSIVTSGNHVRAAYCNDAYLVIHADGLPNHEYSTKLQNIPSPPGGNGCLMRSAITQFNTYKIPLDYTLLDVGVNNSLPGWNNTQLPLAGAVAVAINGVPIYPATDASYLLSWAFCEMDACSAHAGKGGDYHYHGDPFGADCLYTASDVSADNHPILIGWAVDGPSVYGRYTTASQPGVNVALDNCGGHDHDSYGYHYHASVETDHTYNSNSYTAYFPGPKYCWRANISAIPNFWQSDYNQILYDNSKIGPTMFDLASRGDYQQLLPCCTTPSAQIHKGTGVSMSAVTVTGAAVNLLPSFYWLTSVVVGVFSSARWIM